MAEETEHHQSRLSEVLTVALVFLFGAVSFIGVNALIRASDNIRISHQALAESSSMERSAVALQLAILSRHGADNTQSEQAVQKAKEAFSQST